MYRVSTIVSAIIIGSACQILGYVKPLTRPCQPDRQMGRANATTSPDQLWSFSISRKVELFARLMFKLKLEGSTDLRKKYLLKADEA